MEGEQQPDVPATRLPFLDSQSIESLLKASTISLLFVTGIGYIVAALSDARFGFVTANPLRAKTVSAGVLFTIFVAVPVWAGLLADYTKVPVDERWRAALTLAWLSPVSYLAYSCLNNFFDERDWSSSGLVFITMCLSIYVLLKFRATSAASLGPSSAVWLAAGLSEAAMLILAIQHGIEHYPASRLLIWVVVISHVAVLISYLQRTSNNSFLKSFTNIGLLCSVLTGFSQLIYPHILMHWGGGAPTRVTVHFSKDSVYPLGVVHKLLIDETDSGYYLLDPQMSSGAHFVPKASVLLVEYEASGLSR